MLWINGRITAERRAEFDMSDRGLLLADGLFETILIVQSRPILLDQHLERFARGAAQLGIPLDLPLARRAISELVAAKPGDGAIRVTLTRGPGTRGLPPPPEATPLLFASRADWSAAMAFTTPALITSTIRRNATSPLSRLKSLSYLDNVLALQDAQRQGADDALILSTDGGIACTSAANIFIVEGDTLITPPTSAGVLDGIMRGFVLSHASTLLLTAREEALSPDRVLAADGVFLTNSLRLLMKPCSLDGHLLSQRADGVIRRIETAVRETVGLASHTQP